MNDDIKPPRFGGLSKGTGTKNEPAKDPMHLAAFVLNKTKEKPAEAKQAKSGFKKHLLKVPGLKHWRQLSKKQRIASLVILGVLLIGTTAAALELYLRTPEPPAVGNIAVSPPETTKPSRLTGVEVPIELDKMPVTGVMLENSPDARPQSGLQEAGVVFEAIAEGGITRFLALYQTEQPKSIGPVRSVRPYYLDWLVPFDAAIAHAGGSAQALAQIRSQNIRDLDHGFNPEAYQRVSSRFAPHNLYTSREKLLAVHKKRGFNSSKFTGFARKKREKPLEKATAKTINFNISSANYNSVFTYDQKSNSYLRTMAGRAHKDEKTGKRIAPKVVVALFMNYSKNGIYSVYKVNGSNTAWIFQDGGVTKGKWQKKNRKSEIIFTTSDGKTLELTPGQTWIVAAANTGMVKYTP